MTSYEAAVQVGVEALWAAFHDDRPLPPELRPGHEKAVRAVLHAALPQVTPAERRHIEQITHAAYAGGTNRKPEDDVRWLLGLIDRLVANSRSAARP